MAQVLSALKLYIIYVKIDARQSKFIINLIIQSPMFNRTVKVDAI